LEFSDRLLDTKHRVSKYKCIRTCWNSAIDEDQQGARDEVKRGE
jgi:hypothetical protein